MRPTRSASSSRFPARPPGLPRALAVVALLSMALAAAKAAPLDDLRRQVESSQFDQAWRTVQAHPQLMGDAQADFLVGLAALETGRVAEGVLALERHLAAVPANDRARLELARGYFLLGDYGRARAEFEFVLRANPPAGVRERINGFLQAMQLRESADNRSSARAYVELGAGHDNNVNGGTWNGEVQLAFGTVPVTGSPSAQIGDSYGHVAFGVLQQHRVNARMSLFAGIDVDHRGNAKEHDYDLSNANATVGFTHLGAGAQWRGTLNAASMMVGGNRYRDTLQVGAEANVPVAPGTSMLGFVQHGQQRYVQRNELLDSRATVVGGMLSWAPAEVAMQPQLGLRLSWTQDDNVRLNLAQSKTIALARLSGAFSPTPRLRVALGVVAYRQDHRKEDIAFANVRRDDAVSVDGQVTLALTPELSARLEGNWSRTESNQDLYDVNRKALALKLRYQF